MGLGVSMNNHLKNQTSPYLLQHADNPVNWYPWCDEAFERAKAEDKPIFLSIGYSTCHWCHVMAHESFEDAHIAEIMNQYFIAIKVDKEERPDIDSIYMSVCQALTGSGGWPTTIFLTPEQKPFLAGTYFPKTARYGQIGLKELLLAVHDRWTTDRENLLEAADEIITFLSQKNRVRGNLEKNLIDAAFELYKHTFDEMYGGFGKAPKFPAPHNLLFLMQYFEKSGDEKAMRMVEKSLLQMYYGGMFDHIGGGFSRYSTDKYFLVPHFEKMLYDNALLILAYCKAYEITKKKIYCEIAEKTAMYVLREMTSQENGFYSAQDADSEGVEGKYYLLEPDEIISILGQAAGKEFNKFFDITREGNFEGKNIPNLLKSKAVSESFNVYLPEVYAYRKKRYSLHLDDKILTSWNALMITAMCHLYRVTENKTYLNAAVKAQEFIQSKLCEKDILKISYRNNQSNGKGLLDDYANEIFALLALYQATFRINYLEQARKFCDKVIQEFWDREQGGFFLYGKNNEQLILHPKETYDGAIFSGNSVMAYNLVQLYFLTGDKVFEKFAKNQLKFMSGEAQHYPMGYPMFLMALSDYVNPPEKIIVVAKENKELEKLPCRVSLNSIVYVFQSPTKEYPLKNDKTTFYICRGHSCLPPVNELNHVSIKNTKIL